jgi:hypothetical protein
MLLNSFTLAEANEICEDFDDLIDTEFNVDSPFLFLIRDVMPCPFNADDKQRFVDNYILSKNKSEAIAFYTGEEFDVVIFAFDETNDDNYTYVKIRDFVENNGIRYNFPTS